MTDPRPTPRVAPRQRAVRAATAQLAIHQVASREPLELPARAHALATIDYGVGAVGQQDAAAPAGLALRVGLDQLGATSWRELWSVAVPPSFDAEQELRYARTSELLFGALEFDGEGCERAGLERASFDAYRRILALTQRADVHLLRMWNVLPHLHAGAADLDCYMQFCHGRSRAFEAHHGAGFERHLCASSAVGAQAGPALVYFLATQRAGEHVESPRQLSAYRYPARYGPRSPAFARATRAPEALGRGLFVSGTASIVGHASRHLCDVEAQTIETLRNLRVLLCVDDRARLGGRVSLLKVYLRDAGDYEAVQRILLAELGPELPLLCLRADICRPELLVEIECLGLSERPCNSATTSR